VNGLRSARLENDDGLGLLVEIPETTEGTYEKGGFGDLSGSYLLGLSFTS
jgi:hypothetical protein